MNKGISITCKFSLYASKFGHYLATRSVIPVVPGGRCCWFMFQSNFKIFLISGERLSSKSTPIQATKTETPNQPSFSLFVSGIIFVTHTHRHTAVKFGIRQDLFPARFRMR